MAAGKKRLLGHFPVRTIWISFKKDLFFNCNVWSVNISTTNQFVCFGFFRVNSVVLVVFFHKSGTFLRGDMFFILGLVATVERKLISARFGIYTP